MKKQTFWRVAVLNLFLGALLPLQAQVFTTQHNFTGSPDGANPRQPVWMSGYFYGSTVGGGASNNGSIFRFNTNGAALATIYSFTGNGNDGSSPNNLLAVSNAIYGTTTFGGTNGVGMIFSVNSDGTGFKPLYSFGAPPDGYYPYGGLILVGATLYGTTYAGGSVGGGTIFKINTSGAGYAIVHDFTNSPDGSSPQSELVASSGTLYGTTTYGGGGYGTIFSVGTNGANFSVLHNFASAPDGNYPYGGLALSSGELYGTASDGGSNNTGVIFGISTNGSGYNILHHFDNFTGNTNGFIPKDTLTVIGGTIYGTASGGGSGGGGTLFQLNTNGTSFTVIRNFSYDPASGNDLENGVTAVGNILWGATFAGGTSGYGTLFSSQLSPKIVAQPQSLTVTNGSPAVFSVSAVDDTATNYQWYFNTTLPLADQTNNTLALTSATNGNAGTYTVVVSDAFGSVTSSPAVLAVLAYPIIITQPQSVAVTNGNPATFTVTAVGQSPLHFQWFTNSVATNHALTGKTNSTLSFATVSNSLAGNYYVVITNSLGKATSSPAILTIIGKPVITLQPQNVTVTNGNFATFTVEASGASLLKYQWYFRTNTLIAGATNTTLILTNAITNIAGVYRVIITNTLGKATSSLATLTIVSRPNLLNFILNPSNGSVSLAYANRAKSTNRLWATTNLVSKSFWRVIATNVMATNGLWFFTETNSAKTNNFRFYRFSSP